MQTNLARRSVLAAIGGGVLGSVLPGVAEEVEDRRLLLDPAGHEASDPALVSFDRMLTSFMTLYEIPGGALAVTKDSRLVYARGFGWADVNRKRPVAAESLFRIASISKPITGVAILQLVERGKLSLDDRMLDVLPPFKPFLEPGAEVDRRLKEVTVRQLLNHTAGWDSTKSFDPMTSRSTEIAARFGAASPATQEQILRYVFGRPLDAAPGEKYAYSNFGYCVLGRVIEKVSGKSYAEYVQRELFAPLGITRVRLGKTLPADRAAGEVTYYDDARRKRPAVMGPEVGKPVSPPDGAWCLEVMDSHGGWIASAVDLVRFATAFDRREASPLLSAESVRTLFSPPAIAAGKTAFYACGWSVNGGNQFHSGALDGTSTLLVRRGDGLNWAVLFNARATPTGDNLTHTLDAYIHRAADKVRSWPREDLFPKYFAAK